MSRKRYRLSNWKEYNRKLEERGSIEIWFDKEVLVQWNAAPKKKDKKAGRPKEYGEAAIKCSLIFKYLYRGVGITNDNKEVVEVTKSGGHDCTMLSKLLNGVSGKIDNVIGDGAYDGKGCYQAEHINAFIL